MKAKIQYINTLNSEFNPICHLLALLGAHHILQISRIRVKYVFTTGFLLNGKNVIAYILC